MPTADDALVVDGFDVVADADRLQLVYGAAFLYSLGKGSGENGDNESA